MGIKEKSANTTLVELSKISCKNANTLRRNSFIGRSGGGRVFYFLGIISEPSPQNYILEKLEECSFGISIKERDGYPFNIMSNILQVWLNNNKRSNKRLTALIPQRAQNTV